jgi:RHS repeat-associated protein
MELTLKSSAQNLCRYPLYKFGGKEYDEMHGLNLYDNILRNYDPITGRFLTIDPLCEKYYSISPYVYAGNNPINAVDLRGDSITFVAENKDLIKQTTTLINEGVGSKVAKTDKNGVLSVKNLSDKQLSKLTTEQKAFYSEMKGAATSDGMATIGIVSGSKDVFVGSYESGQIDIADVNAFGTGEGASKFSTFAHEVAEQQGKQINGNSYGVAHTGSGIPAENRVSGSTRGRTTGSIPFGTGTISIPFYYDHKTVTITIQVVNNNIIKLNRK